MAVHYSWQCIMTADQHRQMNTNTIQNIMHNLLFVDALARWFSIFLHCVVNSRVRLEPSSYRNCHTLCLWWGNDLKKKSCKFHQNQRRCRCGTIELKITRQSEAKTSYFLTQFSFSSMKKLTKNCKNTYDTKLESF